MSRLRVAFHDPDGARHGTPTFMWRCAPPHLATRRQLRAVGLCPGGRPPVGQIMWAGIGGTRFALLYDITHATPKRIPTPAQRAAIDAALTARRRCPTCHRIRDYYIPCSLGQCLTCAGIPTRERAGRSRRRYRHGTRLHGRCSICRHRTWCRTGGQWAHQVCAAHPARMRAAA